MLELSQIQTGFAKMFKWHQNSLGNQNFKLISEKLESSKYTKILFVVQNFNPLTSGVNLKQLTKNAPFISTY